LFVAEIIGTNVLLECVLKRYPHKNILIQRKRCVGIHEYIKKRFCFAITIHVNYVQYLEEK
jgi:hypothetical protein